MPGTRKLEEFMAGFAIVGHENHKQYPWNEPYLPQLSETTFGMVSLKGHS